MKTAQKQRCSKTVDLEDRKTDEERYREQIARAVDAAFERLKGLRERQGMK